MSRPYLASHSFGLVGLAIIALALICGTIVGVAENNWLQFIVTFLFLSLVIGGSIFFPWHFGRISWLTNNQKQRRKR